MSIAPNVWAISNYFTEVIADPRYNRFKKNVYDLTGKFEWGTGSAVSPRAWKKGSR
jgi:deoxyxylulose-5-phosphate synthase